MASQWEQIKWIPGTKLMVDGFRYQNANCKSYLLTHFHSDHTTGLTKGFTAGLIFCTPVTARLLRKDMGMPAERICEISMDKTSVIEGHEVIPIDANHCPGACMFLIRTKGTLLKRSQTILHTGDMRWDDNMAEHPAIKSQRIDLLFMDTTYAKPTHTHPPQDICIDKMVEIIRAEREKNPKTLFVCGSYHIGKERAYLGAAKILGCKVWCDANKRRVLRMLDLPDELMILLTTKPQEALIHVDFLGALQPERLQKRIHASAWTHAVGFRPTGWTYRRTGKLDCRHEGNVKVYGVPYSEHSSWPELRSCVTKLRPKKLIPTVNASNAALAELIVNRFADCMDLSGDKSRLDFFMRKRQKTSHTPDKVPFEVKAKQMDIKEEEQSEIYQIEQFEMLNSIKTEAEEEEEDFKSFPEILPEKNVTRENSGAERPLPDIQTPELKDGNRNKEEKSESIHTPSTGKKIQQRGNLSKGINPYKDSWSKDMDRAESNESDKTQSPHELLNISTQPLFSNSEPEEIQLYLKNEEQSENAGTKDQVIFSQKRKRDDSHEDFQKPVEKDEKEEDKELKESQKHQGFRRDTFRNIVVKEVCSENVPKQVSSDNLKPRTKFDRALGENLLDNNMDDGLSNENEPCRFSSCHRIHDEIVDLACFSVDEQQRILQDIRDKKLKDAQQVTNSLARTRQASISVFFKR